MKIESMVLVTSSWAPKAQTTNDYFVNEDKCTVWKDS